MIARGSPAPCLCVLGLISLSMLVAHAQDPPAPPRPPVPPIFRALDLDGDGTLSAEEIDGAAAALKTLDADKDGTVSRAEAIGDFGRRPPPDPAATVARLMAFDKDKDGKLSPAELPDRMRALIDRADTNKDGVLDKAELTEYARRQQRPMPAPPAGNPP